MFEVLAELKALVFGGRSDRQLPDCKSILFTIKASHKLDPRGAARFVALCRLTAVATAVRWTSVGLIASTAVLLYKQASPEYIAVSAALAGASAVVFGMLVRLSAYLAGEYSTKAPSAGQAD
jgi:hypothetical protein